MVGEWSPHVVSQGEHLERLAFLRGAEPNAIWNDSRNAKLKAKRASMNELLPGDTVYLPDAPTTWLTLEQGTSNRFAARVPKTQVRLVVRDDSGPIAGARYVVTGIPLAIGQAPLEGRTSATGEVQLSVPINVREVTVTLPIHHLAYQIDLGGLDPHDEPSGIRQRLMSLGFLARSSPPDEDITYSLAEFQLSAGIPITGRADSGTIAALKDAVKSPNAGRASGR